MAIDSQSPVHSKHNNSRAKKFGGSEKDHRTAQFYSVIPCQMLYGIKYTLVHSVWGLLHIHVHVHVHCALSIVLVYDVPPTVHVTRTFFLSFCILLMTSLAMPSSTISWDGVTSRSTNRLPSAWAWYWEEREGSTV